MGSSNETTFVVGMHVACQGIRPGVAVESSSLQSTEYNEFGHQVVRQLRFDSRCLHLSALRTNGSEEVEPVNIPGDGVILSESQPEGDSKP